MEEQIKRRLLDLAAQSDRIGTFTFSPFLSEAEYADFCAVERQLPPCGFTVWGGYPDAERVMIRFGNPERLGYEEPFPIVCLEIAPAQEKFADALTHRDFLGALMHLGISRGELGDIPVSGKTGYLFCTEQMAEYIGNTLERVRHTTVRCSIVETLPETFNAQTVPETVQAASLRADLLIAKVFHMSRSACDSCFASEKVFVNGRAVSQPGMTLKEGDKVSVRGFGKFRFAGVSGQTRKGNLIVEIARFGN